MELAERADAPVVGFIESGGARMHEGVAALAGYGADLPRATCALSGRVPQISVISGVSAGGGSYSPALTDFVVMTEARAMFLTGPGVVHEVMGEDVDAAEPRRARACTRATASAQFVAADDSPRRRSSRELLGYLPQAPATRPASRTAGAPRARPGRGRARPSRARSTTSAT